MSFIRKLERGIIKAKIKKRQEKHKKMFWTRVEWF